MTSITHLLAPVPVTKHPPPIVLQDQIDTSHAYGSADGIANATGSSPTEHGTSDHLGVDVGGDDTSGDGRRGYGKRELSTSKRAAQNRAAQRAFRQRKEGYIKKLEEQVRDYQVLTENFKAVQQENFQLRDYIINLQSRLLESQGEVPPPPSNLDGLAPNSSKQSQQQQQQQQTALHAHHLSRGSAQPQSSNSSALPPLSDIGSVTHQQHGLPSGDPPMTAAQAALQGNAIIQTSSMGSR